LPEVKCKLLAMRKLRPLGARCFPAKSFFLLRHKRNLVSWISLQSPVEKDD
jgi:hypothetical protein